MKTNSEIFDAIGAKFKTKKISDSFKIWIQHLTTKDWIYIGKYKKSLNTIKLEIENKSGSVYIDAGKSVRDYELKKDGAN